MQALVSMNELASQLNSLKSTGEIVEALSDHWGDPLLTASGKQLGVGARFVRAGELDGMTINVTVHQGDVIESRREVFTPEAFENNEARIAYKRSHYRGKNLGKSFTTQQIANITNGSFYDLLVGDYWEPHNAPYKWVIVDINPWVSAGQPHIVVMPTAPLNVDTTTWTGSPSFPTSNLPNVLTALEAVPAAFFGPEHMMTTRVWHRVGENATNFDHKLHIPFQAQIVGYKPLSTLQSTSASADQTNRFDQFGMFRSAAFAYPKETKIMFADMLVGNMWGYMSQMTVNASPKTTAASLIPYVTIF